jgi:hypothetical protein
VLREIDDHDARPEEQGSPHLFGLVRIQGNMHGRDVRRQ